MKNGLHCWIVLLYVIASQTAGRCENNVRVYVKKDRASLPAFFEFVRDNPIYVDKTRFMGYALRKWLGRFVILVAPPRWGKSTLFNMAQFFLQAELDRRYRAVPPNRTASYQFFAHGHMDTYVSIKPPLISRRAALIGRYVARHPVIKLNFNNMIEWRGITTYDEFLIRFKNFMLKQIRDRHRAAMKTLCSDGRNSIGQRVPVTQLYELCNHFENDTLNEIELRHYASKWATWLEIYYAKSPVILVDDYDAIFKALYMTRTFWNTTADEITDALRTRIVDFYTDFLHITHRNSNSLFTLLTGVLPVDIGRGNATYSPYSVVNHQHEDVYQYLGFTEREVDKVFHHERFYSPDIQTAKQDHGGQLPKVTDEHYYVHDMKTAKQAYGGYLVEKKPNVSVFNPLFVLEGAKGWTTLYIPPLGKLRKVLQHTIWANTKVKRNVAQWLLDKRIPSCNPRPYGLLSCDQLQSMNDPGDDEFGALLCSTELLSLLGYLTYDYDQDRFNIPNQECRSILNIAVLYPRIHSSFSGTTTPLIELLENSSRTPDVFVEQYCDSLFWIPLHDDPYDEMIDFCLIKLYDMLRHASAVHGYQCTTEINVTSETSLQEPISGPYLAIHNGTYGAIFEVMYGAKVANLSAVFQRDFSSRVNSFHRAYPHLKTLRMMIINLFPSPHRVRRTIANYLDEVYYNPDLQ